jgi:hypothetical protein
MLKNRKFKLFTALLFINGIILGQHNTNTNFSHFGIGDMECSGLSQNNALGGLSVCLRQSDQINYLNPASYNSQDTSSFLFDLGMHGYFYPASYTPNSLSERRNINFDHLALTYPVTNWSVVSTGIAPYSILDYEMDMKSQYTNGAFDYFYKGSGNLNRFYIGQAFGLFEKMVNFGFNVSYIFGSLNRYTAIQSLSNSNYPFDLNYFRLNICNERKEIYNGFNLNLGMQLVKALSKDIKLTGGVVFETGSKFKLTYSDFIYKPHSGSYPHNFDTIRYFDTSVKLSIPAYLGIGGSILIKEKLLIGLDYVIQDWRKTKLPDQKESFNTGKKVILGIQFIPGSRYDHNYFNRINYRLGGRYNSTYLSYDGNPVKEYTASFGAGLPLKNNFTLINFAFEIGNHRENSDDPVRINLTRICVNITMSDVFVK